MARSKKGLSGSVIFSILVVALAAYIFFFEYRKGEKDKEHKASQAKIFSGLDVSKIQGLIVSPNSMNSKMDIKVAKLDGVWRVTAPLNDVADKDAVETFISTLVEETTQDGLGAEAAESKTYGLDQPKGSVTLTTLTGEDIQVRIGSIKAYDGSLYANVSNKPGTFLVSNVWSAYVDKKPNDFRSKRVKRGVFEGWDRIVTKVSGKQRLELKKVDGEWQSVPKSEIPIHLNLVEGFIFQIVNLEILDFVSEMKTDLSRHGLSSPQVETHLSGIKENKPYDFKLMLSPKAPDGEKQHAAATSTDLTGVVKVYSAIINVAQKTREDFFDRRYPFQYDPTQAMKVRISTPELKLLTEKKDGKWSKLEASIEAELASLQVDELVKAISRMEASGYLKEKGKGLTPPKNKIEVFNEKGEVLVSLFWGDEYQPRIDDPANTGLKFYYATTSKVPKYVLSLKQVQIEELPLKSLFVAAAKKEATP